MASGMTECSIDGAELTLTSLTPAIKLLDEQIEATKGSQQTLVDQITELAEFLRALNDKEVPYDLVSYSLKLVDCKKRVSSTSTKLDDIHDRLSRLQRKIAREIYKKKQDIKSQIPPSVPPK